MTTRAANRGSRSRRVGIAAVLAAMLGVAGALVFREGDELPRVVREPEAVRAREASEPVVAEHAAERAPASGDDAAPDAPPAVYLCTFADGAPVPSLIEGTGTIAREVADWSKGKTRHLLPDGDTLGVIARDCTVVVLQRSSLPANGDVRVDLKRCPVLDVRLVNVPAGLRDSLDLRLQIDQGVLEKAENAASLATDLRRPIPMREDRVLAPLAVARPGRLVVHASSRHSTHSYPTAPVAFEPVSQVIEIDVGELAPACSLAHVLLTLRFPYAYPDGEFDLSMNDVAGSTMMYQRRVRGAEAELHYVFRDLPGTRVHPLLRMTNGASPPIHLDPIVLKPGDNTAVRDIVAESSLRALVSGREGLAANGVSILVRREDGEVVMSVWPRGDEHTFRRLPAMRCAVQAIAFGSAARASAIVAVDLATAQAHEVALQLVPAGRIEVPHRAFGDARHVDAHYPGVAPSRIALHPARHTSVWLPLGEPRVEWVGGEAVLRVAPDVITRWP